MSPPSASQISEISALLTQVASSATGQSLLDHYRLTNTLKIGIGQTNQAQFPANPNNGTWQAIALNLNSLEYYINRNGEWVLAPPVLVLAHELAHFDNGIFHPDPAHQTLDLAGTDYDGYAVTKQNAVAQELGLSNQAQVSYNSAISDQQFDTMGYRTGVSYHDGEPINAVRSALYPGGENIITANSPNGNVASRDLVFGRDGFDSISTGAGVDYVYGAGGADTIDGGSGNDRLVGEMGADSVVGGSGDDVLIGGGLEGFSRSMDDSNDTLDGGEGNDTLSGGPGEDSLAAGAGDDSLAGGADRDTLVGGAGNDTLSGGLGADLLRADADDRFVGNDVSDKIVVTGGNNTIAGGTGNDFIDLAEAPASGSPCTIELNPGDNHEWVKFSSAATDLTIQAMAATSAQIEIVIDSTSRVLTHYSGNPDIGEEDPEERYYEVDAYLKIGNDTVYIGKATWYEIEGFDGEIERDELGALLNNIIVVTSDGETILGDWLESNRDSIAKQGFLDAYDDGLDDYDEEGDDATSGADSVSGSAGSDDVAGGGGADSLSTGDGDDVLSGGTGDDWLSGGGGNDTIEGSKGTDVAHFDGSQGNYAFSRQADGALVVRHVASNAIDILYDIEFLRFGSGGNVDASTLAPLHGTRGRDELANTASGQTVYGFRGDDVVTLTGANNTADGGDGSDTVVLAGQQADYTFARLSDGSVTVQHTATGGSNKLINVETLGFGSASNDVSVRSIVGDYGTPGDDYVAGTANGDHLYGLGGNDFIEGGDGNDTLLGANGNDYLLGGDGIDNVSGGDGNDTLNGGAGDDVLSPVRGNDLLIFELGFGADIIAGYQPTQDTISFEGVGFTDFSDMMSHATQVGANVVITTTAGDTVQLNNLQLSSLHAADFLFS